MSVSQFCILGHQNVNFNAHAVTSMVGLDTFEAVDERREAVCHEGELSDRSIVGSLAGQPSDVFKTRACPVVDDEERENGCAYGIKPPDADLVADEREQKRERVEVYIGLAILRQSLDLRCLHPRAADPDCAFHDNGGYHSENGRRWERGDVVLAAWKELLDGFLENLEETDDHDDGEDEDAQGFETSATDGEFLSELIQAPAHEPVGYPDDDRTEKIQSRVD